MGYAHKLAPLSEKTKLKNEAKPLETFYVTDIESFKWINLVTVMVTDGDGLWDFSVTKEMLERLGHEKAAEEALERYFEFLLSDCHDKTIYAHFGGKFDFLFFLNYLLFRPETFRVENMIPRGSGILCFDVIVELGRTSVFRHAKKKIAKEEVTLTFKDSSAFLPFALKSITKNFKVKSMKMDWDHSKTLPYATPELLEYCGVDCLGLHQSIEKYFSWPIIKRAGAAATIAGQAMRVLRTMIDVEIYSLSPLVDAFVRGAYFGGRTEIFKPLFGTDTTYDDLKKRPLPKRSIRTGLWLIPASNRVFELHHGLWVEVVRRKYKRSSARISLKGLKARKARVAAPRLRCVDVNSLYPTVMREPPKVGNIPQEYPARFKYMTYDYEPDALGFYDAEVEVPEDMYVPPLGVVWEVDGQKKFIFPTGRFKGRWSTLELEYAKSVGVKVLRTGEGAIFESGGNFFRDYVDELYAIRERSKKEGNGVDNVLAKLLLNSCYGRFGLRVDREGLEVDIGQEGFSETEDKKGFIVEAADGRKMRLGRVPKHLETFNNVAVAAWVTTCARVFMHMKIMESGSALFYMDTDSMFEPAAHKDSKWLTTSRGDESGLGGLKIEYECKTACFLLPKTYVVQGGFTKKSKYMPEEQMTGERLAALLHTTLASLKEKNPTIEDWSCVPEGKEIEFESDRKVTMKGFDSKKTSRFTTEDFVSAMEGELRLKVKMPSKFATFKTALGRGKILTMLPESLREIQSLYDKRIVVKLPDGRYDTKPHKIVDNQPIVTKAYEKWMNEAAVGMMNDPSF
jgi:hypothetical protein